MKRIITITILCLGAIAMFAQPALKVASDSNVGIGIDAPSEKLEIAGGNMKISGASAVNQQIGIDVTGTRAGFSLQADGGGTNTDDRAVFTMRNDQGDAVFSVYDESAAEWKPGFNWDYTNDVMTLGGSAAALQFFTPSDKKLKHNVNSFDLGLKEVMQLNPITYKYNGKAGFKSDKTQVGIMAQDLQKVAPMLVSIKKYAIESADQKSMKEEGEYIQIHDNQIKYMLINAIKDQQEIISNQAERLDELEALVASIASAKQINESDIALDDTSIAGMGQNTPNPFNDRTEISYNIPLTAQNASLKFFSMSGKLLRTELISHTGAGKINVSSSNLPSGTYTYALEIDGELIATKKMVKSN